MSILSMKSIGVAVLRLRALWLRWRGAAIGTKNQIGEGLRLSPIAGLRTGTRVQVEHEVCVKLVTPEAGLILEDYVFVGNHTQFDLRGKLRVGANSLIAPGVFITDHGHGIRRDSLIQTQGCTLDPVSIEEDVWIGTKAVILPGVTLAKGTVVGAGAVVVKSTEPYSIVGGVPARVIGSRK